MTFDSRWKNPQGKDLESLWRWAQDTTGELRKGDFFSTQVGNGITNAQLADMAAWTIKMRNAGTTGEPQDVTINGLTEETSIDGSADFLPMWDASGAVMRKAKPRNLAGWTLIAQNTSPGTVAQVDFDQALIALATELLLVWEAITVSASLALRVAFSTDGGSTFANVSFERVQNLTGSENRQAYIEPTVAENNSKQGHCHIICPPGGFKVAHAQGSRSGSSSFNGLAMGTVETTSTIDFVRLLTSTSTLTGGNIRLYGKV